VVVIGSNARMPLDTLSAADAASLRMRLDVNRDNTESIPFAPLLMYQ
jgi:hypothetical protein